MTTIAGLLALRERLAGASDSAALDTELLLCHCLGRDRAHLRAWPDNPVDAAVAEQFLALLARRERGEPIAYLTGETGFWSLSLQTGPATLIPRPETELLVEQGLQVMGARSRAAVLDLGTGTGAVALALAVERPGWEIIASDSSAGAVTLARANRDRLGCARVQVLQSDWFAAIARAGFDLIVSNPPYIRAGDAHLDCGDVRFEPRSALVADRDGFGDIERIIEGARDYLAPGGWLLFEHGYTQGDGARDRLRAAGYTDVYTARDLAGHERVSGGRFGTTAGNQP